ncbi:MAG TPA: 2-C-methyl-D-erythritol 4-phosphate cytidylyltransferase [Lacipirellulaceae bacterium]|jgi:2-C-methyl-D-erythritol 4-phosphate cytidylyltransferase|nr:2-C-methyl-D-erythritol 4-phosphate cytidylyltransferase [Lacipirellulaceae bacterium]
MSTFAVILPAAGQSRRFHDKAYKKPFAPLGGRAVWLHSAERFMNRSDVKQVIVCISAEDREFFNMKFGANIAIMGVEVIEGGEHRTDTVQRALERVKNDIDFIAIHDAARPCIAEPWIDSVFAAAERDGAAILAAPVQATLKRADEKKRITATVDRDSLWEAQTPQVFRRQLLIDAYAKRGREAVTDDAQLVERLGKPVTIVPCSALNIKITTRDDLKLAEQVLKVLPKPKLDKFQNPFAGDDLWR